MQLPVAWVPVDKQDQVFRSLIHKLNIKNDHTSRLNRKLNSLAVISMHPERVNELELNNRPIKVFIELTECGNVDTEVQTYRVALSNSQSYSKPSSFTLSEYIDSTAKLDNLSSSIVVLKCVFISLRQLKDLSDATDVTGIVQAIYRRLFSS